MVDEPRRTLADVVRHVGLYPEEAFLFVREGLGFAADQVHGPESDCHRALQDYLIKNDLDWDDLVARYHAGTLPDAMVEAIDAGGGWDTLNRHVSGRELCWALRDYAMQRWGFLARVVLESWNIKGTSDFGRVVFGFIEFDMLRKQEADRLEDFENVYSFDGAFEAPFGSESRD